MIKTVTVRGVEIGSGMPKICAPIVGKTQEEVVEQAKRLPALPVDLCEWRIDHLSFPLSAPTAPQQVSAILPALRQALGNIPLLVTFRTQAEGGEQAIEPEAYTALLCDLAATGLIDLLDVELALGQKVFDAVLAAAHAHGVKVIASNHDFHATPAKEEIMARLTQMEEWGADIAKIAVMPQDAQDTLTPLDATHTQFTTRAHIPLITMSMSQLGVSSRLFGEKFGSAVTFGSAAAASAPGQPDVKTLHDFVTDVHQRLMKGDSVSLPPIGSALPAKNL